MQVCLNARYSSSTLFPFLFFWVSLLKLDIRKKGTLCIMGLLGVQVYFLSGPGSWSGPSHPVPVVGSSGPVPARPG